MPRRREGRPAARRGGLGTPSGDWEAARGVAFGPPRSGLVLCRYYRGQWCRQGKQRLIYAFWGLKPPSFDWVRETDRQRFAIETTYRQLHQARIRTTTRDPLRRLLYVGIALILRNVWVWLHQIILARPRRGSREIRLDLLRFRRMLQWLAHVVEQRLGVQDSVTFQLC